MPLDAIQLPFNCYKIVIKLSWNCIAASLSQRCIGVSQRPIPMPRYGSSAVLVYFSAPLFAASLLQPRTGGFWPLTRVPAPRWWTPAPLSYTRLRFLRRHGTFQRRIFMQFSGAMPHWRIPTSHSYAASRLQRRTAGLQRFMLTQHRVNNDRAPETQANNCCVAAWQPLTKTRSDGCLR